MQDGNEMRLNNEIPSVGSCAPPQALRDSGKPMTRAQQLAVDQPGASRLSAESIATKAMSSGAKNQGM